MLQAMLAGPSGGSSEEQNAIHSKWLEGFRGEQELLPRTRLDSIAVVY